MTTHTRSALLLVLLTSLIALGCGSSSKTVDGDIDVQVGGNDILGTSDSTVTQDVPTFDFSLPPADATIDLVSLDVKQEDAQVGDTSTADQPTSDAVLGDLTADTDDGGTLDSTVSDAGDQTGDSASDLSGDTQVADLAELDGDDGADGVVPNDSTDISEDDGSADATGDSSSDGDALSCVDDDLGTTAVGVLSALERGATRVGEDVDARPGRKAGNLVSDARIHPDSRSAVEYRTRYVLPD